MKRSHHPGPLIKICLLLFLFQIGNSACGMMPKEHERDYERLDKIIKLYNNEFESKSDAAGSMWVRDDLKADYLTKVKDFHDRVNIVNSQTISITFKNLGKMVSQSGSSPGDMFDEAVVTNRYEYVISPSVSLKTKIIKQRWILEKNGTWKLIPDLDAFFN